MAILSPASPSGSAGVAHTSGVKVRLASIRYMGFRSTGDGREYTLRVEGEGDPRVFVILIPHAAFSERRARFQDAPDLCYAKLQRELALDAALAPGKTLVLTAADLADYRDLQTKRSPERKRRRPPIVAEQAPE